MQKRPIPLSKHLFPDVQRADNVIQWVNRYPLDKKNLQQIRFISWISTYLQGTVIHCLNNCLLVR